MRNIIRRGIIVLVLGTAVVVLIAYITKEYTPETKQVLENSYSIYSYRKLLDDNPDLPMVMIEEGVSISNNIKTHEGYIVFNKYGNGNNLLAVYIGNYTILEDEELKWNRLYTKNMFLKKEYEREAVLRETNDGTRKWVNSFEDSPLIENQKDTIAFILKQKFEEVYIPQNRVLISTSDLNTKD
ncbi:MAG: hypothetical protein ISR98_00370 [Parcubacteria group bacterium]|nr:hypothetical protein [Parcubacteria group bacterium]